jgi:hypothetical protein
VDLHQLAELVAAEGSPVATIEDEDGGPLPRQLGERDVPAALVGERERGRAGLHRRARGPRLEAAPEERRRGDDERQEQRRDVDAPAARERQVTALSSVTGVFE